MRKYILNDKESKTLLNMADDCIDRGMVGEDYEVEKISRILDYDYELYHKTGEDFEVEIEVKIKNKTE